MRSRAKGWLRHILVWMGWVLAVIVMLAVGSLEAIFLVLEFSPKTVVATTNAALSGVFRGELRLRQFERISLRSVAGVDFSVHAPDGRLVLVVEDATVGAAWVPLVWDVLRGEPLLNIRLERVEARSVHADLSEANGELLIAQAFTPAKKSKPSPRSQSIRLSVPSIDIAHGWVHGTPSNELPLDAVVKDLRGALFLDENTLTLEDISIQARLRRLAGLPAIEGKVGGRARLAIAGDPVRPDSALVPAFLLRSSAQVELMHGESLLVARHEQVGQRLSLQLHGELSAQDATGLSPRLRDKVLVQGMVSGDSPTYRAKVRAAHRGGHAQGEFELQLAGTPSVTGDISVSDVSPSWFAPEAALLAPLSAQLDVALRQASHSQKWTEWSAWRAELSGEISTALPQSGRETTLQVDGAWHAPHLRLDVHTLHPAWDTFVRATGMVRPHQAWPHLEVEFGTDLRLLSSFIPAIQGDSGALAGTARLNPNTNRLDAHVRADLDGLSLSEALDVRRVSARARLTGALFDPAIDGLVTARDLTLFPGSVRERSFRTGRLSLRGRLSSSQVRARLLEDGRTFALSAQLQLQPAVSIRDIVLTTAEESGSLSLRAEQLSVDSGGAAVQRLRFAGIADGELNARYRDGELQVSGSVRDLSLARLARITQLDLGVVGLIDWDADIAFSEARGAEGRMRVVVSQGRVLESLSGDGDLPLEGTIDVVGEGRRVGLRVEVSGGPAESPLDGHLQGLTRLPVRSSLSDPQAWLRSLVELEGEFTADLALVPVQFLPEGVALEGQLDANVRAVRDRTGETPRIQVGLETTGLALNYPRTLNGRKTMDAVSDFDVKAYASIEPVEAQHRLWVGLIYQQQLLASTRLRVSAPLAQLDTMNLTQAFLDVPLKLDFHFPDRAIESLPERLGVSHLRGHVGASLRASGTLRDPQLEANARVADLRTEAMSRREGFSGDLSLTAQPHRASLEATLEGPGTSGVGMNGQVRMTRGATPWTYQLESGEALVRFEQVPVELVRVLSDQQLGGSVSGQVFAKDWGTQAPRAGLKLDLSKLRVQRLSLKGTHVTGRLTREALSARVEIKGNDFAAEAEARAQLTWPSPWLFGLGDELVGNAAAKDFPLRLLRPLLSDTVADLDGMLDLDARAERRGATTALEGRLAVTGGSLQLPRLGQNFQDVNLDLVWQKDGKLRLRKGTFRGVTGKGRLSGGATMEGLQLREAQLRLQVDRDERLPVSVQGLGLGEFWGDIETSLTADWESRSLASKTAVRAFHLRFPQIPGSVQSLADDPRIDVGVWANQEDFVELPLQPLEDEKPSENPWVVAAQIDLGNETWLEQGPTRRVQVGGALRLEIKDDFRPSGELLLSRGRIEINGRMFEVREGTIAMQPDEPDNPIIVAEARWTAPEGIDVVARFTGPVNSGVMTLSSEPPLPKDQVLSLLLFGDTDGMSGMGEGSGSPATGAAAAGGGLFTQGLNRVLRRIDAVDISTRVSGANSDNVRPEVVVQLTNSLSLQVGYNIQEPSPGQSPDRTLVSLELRLIQGHALSGTIGDRGSSFLDWVWRYRYGNSPTTKQEGQ